MIVRPALVLLVALLTACGGATPDSRSPELAATLDAQPFDREASNQLLAEGRQIAPYDPAAAVPLFRAAGLRWPDNLEAWQSLADLERSSGNATEAAAADFMVERLRLYPSEELYVQRQVNAALRTYLEEQRALPGHNPATQTYGARLALFYDSLLAERPTYEPPSGIFNVGLYDLPAVLLTGGVAYLYFSNLSR